MKRPLLDRATLSDRQAKAFAARGEVGPAAGICRPLAPAKQTLNQRTAQLAVNNQHLKQGIRHRKTAEVTLRKSGEQSTKLLEESRRLQEHLQCMTHQLLSAQEEERKTISRELHDEIAQTLLGIHVRLLTLKRVAEGNKAHLRKVISSTQRAVKESIQSINRFAHALTSISRGKRSIRPAVARWP